MAVIDLGSPRPRSESLSPPKSVIKKKQKRYLKKPSEVSTVNFFDVVDKRESRRSFSELTSAQLSEFLWYSSRTKRAVVIDGDAVYSHRPAPSAGGCHPIDQFIFLPNLVGWEMFFYESIGHCLRGVEYSEDALESFLIEVDDVLSIQQGAIVWFGANFGKTQAKYHSADSLVWRDAGVLIGHMALVAESLGLSFCPLGITGEPCFSQLLPESGLLGVGGCIVGGRG